MAEWRTFTRKSDKGVVTFGVIGNPFPFIWASPHGDPAQYLRCFYEEPEEKQDLLRYQQYNNPNHVTSPYYDLVFKKVGEGEEVYEEGWYLSGVGHHLMWCAPVLEDAVDVAQELIAWDGSDPWNLPVPVLTNSDGSMSYKIPYRDASAWKDDSLWFGAFTGKRMTGTENDPSR